MPIAFGAPAMTATCTGEGHGAIDLGPYLTGLALAKDMAASAGTWELDLPYATDRTSRLLDIIQPVDYVEISVRTSPADARVTRMRGFVDNISEEKGIDAAGKPTRRIVLNGRDYGGRLQEYKIFYPLASADISVALLYTLSLTLKYGLTQSAVNLRPNTFMSEVFHKVLRAGFLDPLQVGNPGMATLEVRTAIPPQFGYDTLSIQSFMGAFDDLFRQYKSPPWGEYFVRDDPDAPRLYLRPAPFYAADGAFCWRSAAREDIRYVLIRALDTMNSSLHRTANEVYTYFFTTAESMALTAELSRTIGLAGGKNPYYDGVYNPDRVRRFGFQPLEPNSPWIPLDPKGGNPATGTAALDLQTDLNGWLVRAFGYGEYLRNGTLATRGVHGARIGDYLLLEETGEVFYVQGMATNWSEGAVLQTDYQLIRGQAGVVVTPTAFPAGSAPPLPLAPTQHVSPPPAGFVRYAPGSRDI